MTRRLPSNATEEERQRYQELLRKRDEMFRVFVAPVNEEIAKLEREVFWRDLKVS